MLSALIIVFSLGCIKSQLLNFPSIFNNLRAQPFNPLAVQQFNPLAQVQPLNPLIQPLNPLVQPLNPLIQPFNPLANPFNSFAPSPTRAIVAGYNSEIAVYKLSGAELTRDTKSSWKVDQNLSWLQQVGGSLFAIHEVSEFEGVAGSAISRWEEQGGQLIRKDAVRLKSSGPAHLLVDSVHNLVIVSHYGAGTVSVVPLAGGRLGRVVQELEYGEGCRDKSHPHQAVIQGDLAWVVDLGCDAIYTYRISGGQLVKQGVTQVEAGAGPRHMVIKGSQAVVVCEQKNLVMLYGLNPQDGSLTFQHQLPLSSSTDTNYGAEILTQGDYVYASSRGDGVISVFKVVGQALVHVQELKIAGTWPRAMAIKNNIMLVAQQKGGTVQIVEINPSTGRLVAGGLLQTPSGPAFVAFIN